MRKVIKNVTKTIVATICVLLLVALALPLAVSLLASVPSVQNAVVRRVVSNLSDKLGTRVSIEHIDVKLINRVVVDGFYVEDFHGDTLLYVPRLTAPVIEWGLGGGQLTFGRVTLEQAQMWIRRDSTGVINIRELVAAARGGKPKNPDPRFRMRIMGIEAQGLTFGLLRDDKPPREKGVDFSRFILRNTSVDIDEFSIARDSIRIGIRSLSFDERSGFGVDDLSADDLVVSRGAVSLDNVRILSDETDLKLPSICLTDGKRDWTTFRNFTENISIDTDMRSSRLSTDFLGHFVPVAADWGLIFDDLALHTSGPLVALSGAVETLCMGDADLVLDFTSNGLPDIRNTRFDANLRHFATTGANMDSLARVVMGRRLPESVLAPVGRLGAIDLTGEFKGTLADFDTHATLASDAGNMEATANVATLGTGTSVEGTLSVAEFDLGRVLAVKDLGAISGDFNIRGTTMAGRNAGNKNSKTNTPATGNMSGEVEGDISSLEYRDYAYTGITLDATLSDGVFGWGLVSHDPSLDLEFSGTLDRRLDTPRYNLDLDLDRADLVAMWLNRKDSISVVSGRVVASGTGTRLDDMNGTLELRDAVYVSQYGTVGTPLVSMSARNEPGSKLLSLASEFVDAEFRSRTGYGDTFAYIGDFLSEYIPLFSSDKEVLPPLPPEGNAPDVAVNYSVVGLKIKNTDRLLGALSPGIGVAEGSEASFMFNPYIRSFSLSARSDFIEYKNLLATGIELVSDNKSDSLMLHLVADDIYSGSMHIPDFALHGGAKERRMRLTTRFSDQSDNLSAMLGVRIDSPEGEGGESDGERAVRLRFSPSWVSLDNKTWRIGAGAVTYDGDRRFSIDDLRILSADNPAERLTIAGTVSRGSHDTLGVRLNDFDLSPLGRLFGGDKRFAVGGRATGYIDLISLLADPKMNAGIDLAGLSFNGIEGAPMRFTSFWDRSVERIRFQMLNEQTGVNVLYGSVSPTRGLIDAVADIESLDVGLLDPLLGGVLENSRGEAGVRLTLGGTFDDLRMNGRIEIPHFETTVGYTKASYILDGGEITVENSLLELPPTIVRDNHGGSADLSMRVDMSNLQNVEVEIDAVTRSLLAFDTGPGDNEAFYGRVFATGSVGIRAGRMGTRMNISARTDRGSEFHLPLNAKSNISWADFVTFTDPALGMPDATDVLARKKFIYERRLQGSSRPARRRPLEIGITARLTPEAEVHLLIDPNLGEGITANGEGIIGLTIDPAADLFDMTGDYAISRGEFDFSMMDVFNKDFVIAPGSTLRWTGAPEDALLNVKASYRVRTSLLPLVGEGSALVSGRSSVPVDCILQLSGRLSEPEITFDIDLPSADPDAKLIASGSMNTQELKSMQFLSLLMTGSFAADNSITGQSANSGAMATGAVGFDILTNQLNNLLSSEDYDIYFRYRPQSDYTGNQFDLGVSTRFLDNRLQLEIEGNYVDDRAAMSVGTSNVGNLAGDVSLTWVIDKAGNLRLKVFSQSIDRLTEDQGRQESGLGIYWKKDFDGIGDFFRRSSSRPHNKNSNFADDSIVVKKPRAKNRNK